MVQPQQQQTEKRQLTSTAPKPSQTPALTYEPGVNPDAVDVVGIIPGDVHVDPEITEGHPGYEESGDSEVTQHL
jgi:hypothetical protein